MTSCATTPPTAELVLGMLVQSVACGDDGLHELLTAEAPTIWCMTADCRADLHYLNAQLGVIDYAMLYARNQIDLAMLVSTSAIPHVAAGRVKALGVTSGQRLDALPQVPAMTALAATAG